MPVHQLQWKVWSLSHLRVLILHGLVILLETWNCNTTQVTRSPWPPAPTYAEVGLTLGTVILGLPPQNPAAAIRRVPAEVTRQGGAVTSLGETRS